MLNLALNRFGWVFGGSVSAQKFGRLRHGRRINVQATGAGRRRRGMKRGKMQIAEGQQDITMKTTQRLLEMRRRETVYISTNVTKGTQNAGRRRESVYILLVQMSPKALKMQENGDVNVSYK